MKIKFINIVLIFISILISLIFILALDGILYRLLPSQSVAFERIIDVPNDVLGYFHLPNLKNILVVESYDREMIVKYSISTDKFGKRKTILPPNSKRESAILFFGCSYTWGNGLNDSETLPSAFAKISKGKIVPYNFGHGGANITDMLAWLESNELTPQIKEPVKYGVYVFIADHYLRAAGVRGFPGPFYQLKDNNLIRVGTFPPQKHTFRQWLGLNFQKLGIVRYFNLPSSELLLTQKDKDTFCAILKKSRDIFQMKFPASKFLVLNYTYNISERNAENELVVELKKCASAEHISVIDTPASIDPESFIPRYLHPSTKGNEITAEALFKKIQSN